MNKTGVNITLSPEDKQILQRLAGERRIPVSAYCKLILFEHINSLQATEPKTRLSS